MPVSATMACWQIGIALPTLPLLALRVRPEAYTPPEPWHGSQCLGAAHGAIIGYGDLIGRAEQAPSNPRSAFHSPGKPNGKGPDRLTLPLETVIYSGSPKQATASRGLCPVDRTPI